jgi:hypothetical protein
MVDFILALTTERWKFGVLQLTTKAFIRVTFEYETLTAS